MDWIQTLGQIKNKLEQHGYVDSVARIIDAQMVLGTPGEMYLEVMNVLLSIKRESDKEHEIIKQEVSQLLEYGKSLNFFNPEEQGDV